MASRHGLVPKHRTELTYGFYPASKFSPEAIKVFRDSFKRWSLPLRGVINITEAKAFDKANIQIGYGAMNELFGVEAVGATFMVKPSNYHRVWMVIDYSKYWEYPDDNLADTPLWKFGVVDLETVAMHQIGHVLGLNHSSHKESVMYPSILPDQQRKVDLSKDDKEQIRKAFYIVS